MPEPIEYRAVRSLQAALQSIAVAAGYHYTVQGLAVRLDPDQAVEDLIPPEGLRPFIVIGIERERWTYEPASELDLVQPVSVFWVHLPETLTDEGRLLTYFRGCADVEKAISVDFDRGGLASDTRIVGRERALRGQEIWAALSVEMTLHRQYGQPNG